MTGKRNAEGAPHRGAPNARLSPDARLTPAGYTQQRAEVEAAVWRAITRPDEATQAARVAAIMAAADRYAAAYSTLITARRRILYTAQRGDR